MKLHTFFLLIVSNFIFTAIAEVSEADVTFYLSTKENPSAQGNLLTDLSLINPYLATKILIHGYWSNYLEQWLGIVGESFQSTGDYNVIMVDWSGPAQADAAEGPANAAQVADFFAAFIKKLVEEVGVNLGDIHLIGHSYGGYISGLTGKRVIQILRSKVARITGLDPFPRSADDYEHRVDKEDAVLVDIIHTSIATGDQIGLIDFFPNGGLAPQPGCNVDDGGCSHIRATYLFAEEVINTNGFVATKCDSMADFQSGNCDGNEKITMGGKLDVSMAGKYYFETKPEPPYSL